jgi:hypothetical protein
VKYVREIVLAAEAGRYVREIMYVAEAGRCYLEGRIGIIHSEHRPQKSIRKDF